MSANPMNVNQEACEWVAKMHDADLSVEQAEQLRQPNTTCIPFFEQR